jgi:putative intracellular protease/amidase
VVAQHDARIDLVSSRDTEPLKDAIRRFYDGEKPTAIYCHGTAALADLKLSESSYLVEDKTVTGFSNQEEDYSPRFVGQQVMPWRNEDMLRQRGANHVQGGLFKAFVVREGRLITGQQQYSGRDGRAHADRGARRVSDWAGR